MRIELNHAKFMDFFFFLRLVENTAYGIKKYIILLFLRYGKTNENKRSWANSIKTCYDCHTAENRYGCCLPVF